MFTYQFKPRFRDTDQVGHVNNAVFLTYLELGRTGWIKTIRPSQPNNRFFFIIARIEIDYINPIHAKNEIQGNMWVSKIGNKSWEFSYTLINLENEQIFAKAKSIQVSYDFANDNTTPITDNLRDQLKLLMIN